MSYLLNLPVLDELLRVSYPNLSQPNKCKNNSKEPFVQRDQVHENDKLGLPDEHPLGATFRT